MKQSLYFVPTLREAPADAEVISHRLMLRAGFIRKVAAGVYSFLPLGLRVLEKIKDIIREEMAREGAHEVLLPLVMPAELWQESGRWDYYGRELLRFKDRHERDFCLGPTHEEAITDLVRTNVSSYRQLPLNLYQIQNKFRDEIRPRFGLMRGREFVMKDGYSFHADEASAQKTYWDMHAAYCRIFRRAGLDFRPVEAMTGAIGGSLSHEFQVLAKSGEDPVLICSQCDYAANVEKAALKAPVVHAANAPALSGRFKEVETPHVTTVEEVSRFLKISPEHVVKTLIFETEQGPVAALLRGDHDLVEAKLKFLTGCNQIEPASRETIEQKLGGAVGYSGPLGLPIPLYADQALKEMQDFVVGANRADAHFMNVNLGDFKLAGFDDLRRAVAGDACPRCDEGRYEEHRGIEVGQVFLLGKKYSEPMKAKFLDAQGHEQVMVMGTYGIGVSRTAAAAIEQHHDEAGIRWPYPIAPFHFHLLTLQPAAEEARRVSEELYRRMIEKKLEVLWDERDESPGVKFKDSDLIGIPFRIAVGIKGLKEGKVEVKSRMSGEVVKISLPQALDYLVDLHAAEAALFS